MYIVYVYYMYIVDQRHAMSGTWTPPTRKYEDVSISLPLPWAICRGRQKYSRKLIVTRWPPYNILNSFYLKTIRENRES